MITNPKLASFSDEDLIAELKYRGYAEPKKSTTLHCERNCNSCKFLNNYPKCYSSNNVACEDWMKAKWAK